MPLLISPPRSHYPKIFTGLDEIVCPKDQTKVSDHLHRNMRLDKNRPVRSYQKTTVKFTAQECSIFVGQLNMILAQKIPVADEYWKLYLELREISKYAYTTAKSEKF